MHLGTVRIKNRIIYIDYKDNQIICYYYENKKQIQLDKNIIITIIKELVTCHKKKFLYKNDYEVYLDELTGYKHFYQNGKEDYTKFFTENGENAILFNKNIANENEIKTFIIKGIQIGLIFSLFMTLVTDTSNIITSDINVETLTNSIQYNELSENVNIDTLKNYILNSNELSEYEKQLFINSQFLTDLSKTPMTPDRILSLEEKMTDITIEYGPSEDFNITVAGWYTPLYPNIIHVVNENDDDTKIHEFIHLVQDDNAYSYIKEACADLISYEYYNANTNSYSDETIRLKFLMELIGSDTIWNLNFSGSTQEFENKIREILPEKDATVFFELLRKAPANLTKEERNQLNEAIDTKLYQMYNVLTQNEGELNKLIEDTQIIYSPYSSNQTYFKENTQDNYSFQFIKILPLEEAVKKNIVEINVAEKVYIDKQEVQDKESRGINTFIDYDLINDNYEMITVLNENQNFIDYVLNKQTNQTYSIDDAEKLGYLQKKYWYYEYVPANYEEVGNRPVILNSKVPYNINIKQLYPFDYGYKEGQNLIMISYEMTEPINKTQTKTK